MGITDPLEWTPNFVLNWSDFQAESNPAVFEDSHSVIKYRFTWTVDSDQVDDEIVFLIKDIHIIPEFHPLLSWVRLSESNDALLHHEQVKFDLAEFVKNENISKFQNKFYKWHFTTRGKNEEQRKQFAKEDSGKMINEEIEKLQKAFDEKSQKYQEETNFGQNLEKQSEYDKLISQLK